MSEPTYILIVPKVGEIIREEFREDDDLQLQKAMKSDHIFSKSDPHIVLGRVVITGLTDKREVVGLTAEQCDKILERLNMEG